MAIANKIVPVGLLAALFVGQSLFGVAQAQLSDTQKLIQAGIIPDDNSYVYQVQGRTDPFKPFVAKKTAGPNPNDIVEDDKKLTGMQLFEPGQLSLVGVMQSATGNEWAYVEDQAKKGYVIKVGTLIGRRGVVSQIMPDKVVVEETAKTRSGEIIKSTVAMRLHKEGDK